MIEDQYVSYRTAILLKKYGFSGSSDKYYIYSYTTLLKTDSDFPIKCDLAFDDSSIDIIENQIPKDDITKFAAPTQSVALRWLREEKNIFVTVEMGCDVERECFYYYAPLASIYSTTDVRFVDFGEDLEFATYEGAIEHALQYILLNCLN